MKKFKFRLQSVHDLREMTRNEAERALAAAQLEVTKAKDKLDHITRLRNEAMHAYVAKLQGRELDPAEAAARASYIASLTQIEAQSRAEFEVCERECKSVRDALIEATRDHETTAKLCERQRARHEMELNAGEQRMLDEIATIAVAHRQTKHV